MRRVITILTVVLLSTIVAQGQIKIGGNVYGGGNHAEVKGSTKVTVKAGDIGAVIDPEAVRPLEDPQGKVFGGARMANVGGNTFVHIDGEHATDFILVNKVYGGNDVAGTIGTAKAVDETMPAELTAVKREAADADNPKKNVVDDTFNSYVRISSKLADVYYTQEECDAYNTGHSLSPGDEGYLTTESVKTAGKIYIGQLFAGGNGDFEYPEEKEDGEYVIRQGETIIAKSQTPFVRPDLDKTYLEVLGGSIVYAYGGGNNATVKQQNIIHIDNPSEVVNHILVNSTTGVEAEAAKYTTYENNIKSGSENPVPDGFTELLSGERFLEMGINTTFSHPSSGEYQVGRFFGGNNKAEMSIRPTWNLLAGSVRNLYSGGNRGNMTSPEGLLLEIPTYSTLAVDNVFGGCRMADVKPTKNGIYVACTNLQDKDEYGNLKYKFPDELSARTLVRGGHINNIYGGNDITGMVYGGNAIGVYTTVYGDVYGGGNGNYPYTDFLENDPVFGDLYYDPGSSSITALNAFRPNAEQVSIRLKGNAPEGGVGRPDYTIIKGSVYLGGNCASLATKNYTTPKVELKIGSYVIADNVFLGNNGAGMVEKNILKYYAGNVDENGNYTESDDGRDFSSLDMSDTYTFRQYMLGVAMPLKPSIVFDNETNGDPASYEPFTSFIGSFYCGGNVGSMTIAGKESFTIDQGVNIYDKFVGGCKNADVAEGPYNASYNGGVIGTEDEWENYTDASGIKDRIEINLENLTITPLRWNAGKTQLLWNTNKWGSIITALEKGAELEEGAVYYTSNPYAEQTVTGTAYTVQASDKYFEKLDNGYISIAAGTELAVGSKYYTYSDIGKNTAGAGGHIAQAGEYLEEQDFVEVDRNPSDHDIRLLGGNVYGGCYESGHVNGNVVININQELLNRDKVFGDNPNGVFGNRASGVDRIEQRDDLMAVALSVFGAGYGKKTEIWGSTTVNHNNGYTFQIFGGGELGVVGKSHEVKDEHGVVTGHEYSYDPAYSSTVNLNGASPIYSNDGTAEDLAEAEYLYGGGNEGDVCGNTYVNLGNGRVYDVFGGACNADILGHTETIIGRQLNGSGGFKPGFPWLLDNVYGGNDFGGTISGAYEEGFDATARIRDYDTVKDQLNGYAEGKHDYLLKGASYVEYLEGRVDTIFGGSYGSYDYTDTELYGVGSKMPRQKNAFVNLRPENNDRNGLKAVFGAGAGYPGNREDDKAQDHSYVLVDIPDAASEKFQQTDVFGAGSYNGIGMREDKSVTFAPGYDRDKCSAIIDLLHGQIGNVYGGSYNEGNTCRTVVNVPAESTIKINNIFGGAYGTQILPPCDVIQAIVNYNNTSEKAVVTGAIYGGNNNERRSLFTQVNISSPVWSDKPKGYLAKVYGAGHGIDTWSEHTLVNLLSGAKVYEVYGGGEMGHVLNAESIQKYMQLYKEKPSPQISAQDPKWSDPARWDGAVGTGTIKTTKLHESDEKTIKQEWDEDWKDAWSLGDYYSPIVEEDHSKDFKNYFEAFADLRGTSLVYKADIDDRDFSGFSSAEKAKRQYIYSTNVVINEGAEVVNYAYGGGFGKKASSPSDPNYLSGDVYGHTYIALLGGTVRKDIYAAGTAGSVNDIFGVGAYNAATGDPKYNPYGFTSSTTAYIKGGSCRNVYGGGWEGNVGKHTGDISDTPVGDIPGETHVIVGDMGGSSFTNGVPAIQRNVYGGGEGGAVYGTAHVKLNNGYIGYVHLKKNEAQNERGEIVAATGTAERYDEKIIDETATVLETGEFKPNTNLTEAGCVFGGGYIDNSSVDKTNVVLNGGQVRNSVFGGGEVAAIGRGDMKAKTSGSGYEVKGIYRPGRTHVDMYSGHVHRNVFGGGRGYDNLGRTGSLHCPGYIFGQTEVHIHGGEIGTTSGVADGDGNVFGGGDVGYVYSAYENEDGTFGRGVKTDVRYGGKYQGYYYKHAWENGSKDEQDESLFLHENGNERVFTEDCRVLVEPMLQVLNSVKIGETTYSAGEFVPIESLNLLSDKNTDADKWSCLDQTGIIIHNAVFAGGNAEPGSMTTGVNTNTVFGNATASINDIYHRDMITLGTRHTGGLYGDGNLTLVDGYRELNITNYGTDYYSIAKEIDINTYHDLPDREAAYYELNYTCTKECQDKNGTIYRPAAVGQKPTTITADDMLDLFLVYNETTKAYESFEYGGKPVLVWNADKEEWEPNSDAGYWVESGVLPVYAGRLMNSIQRADFCGVFGSRMVMQGAQDRVPEEVDYTNYTINRVREVSLNKQKFKETDPETTTDFHGNYFGIYNVVNYLGALTSDVHFSDVRKTDNTNTTMYQCDAKGKPYGEASFLDWKKAFIHERTRNNGNSHNKVALASGVYLEITTEESTGDGLNEKVWGPITGVVELDLINVSTGIGGGFVYAKNVHGVPTLSGAKNTTLTELNKKAVTQWDYNYDATDAAYNESTEKGQFEWETSGNLVHSTQTIIDDCYNVSNRYYGANKMPAHFWYIKGSTYVYDQYISAYTGQPNAYSEVVDIPLTIAAASHGKMKLLNVMPNRYAYYASPGVPLGDDKKMIINGKTYYKNDPISYWDWYLLSNYEKELFIEKTYTNCVSFSIDGGTTVYEPGTYVMTEAQYDAFGTYTYTDAEGAPILDANKKTAGKDYIFRLSNNVSHDKGYILTYEVNNPRQWDNWFTPKNPENNEDTKITLAQYEVKDVAGQARYEDGPTYSLKAASGGEVLGQREYKYGDLIPKDVEDKYQKIPADAKSALQHQATFEPAYIVKNKITVSGSTSDSYYNVGTTVPQSFANNHSTDCEEAYICTKTIQLSKDNLIYKDSKMKKSEWQTLYNSYKDGTDEQKKIAAELLANIVPAYICTSEPVNDANGNPIPYYYGGSYYKSGENYRGLEAWSSMSSDDRAKFKFNYDALDLLIDPNYTTAASGPMSEGQKYQYDSADKDLKGAQANAAHYSLETSVDYTAEYNSETSKTLPNGKKVTVTRGSESVSTNELRKGDELSRDVFENQLVNEQRHYTAIPVNNATEEIVNNVATGKYVAYVVNTSFQIGSTPYAIGETISPDTYSSLPPTEQGYVTEFKFSSADHTGNAVYYYCRESYPQGTTITPISSATIPGAGGGVSSGNVQIGTLIAESNYKILPNEQKNFTIHGISPTETSTLYVSRESNIYDLSKEKIITAIYQYDYDETDVNGNVTPISERHVVNIHLTFKSGVPTIEDITPPEIILPGDKVFIPEPTVTPGAYEITGYGWELFATQRDAESHTNGVEYDQNFDKLYWYQDGYYVAYYAKSYLGRTYSNAVPVSVANYHDLMDVIANEEYKSHHMYIDHRNVKRDPKIYINDYSASGKNGLDLFKDLYDLSLVGSSGADENGIITTGKFTGHHTLDNRVKGGNHLEFFMRTDIDHTGSEWEPIGSEDDPSTTEVNEEQCFEGNLHGDGHTISGLTNSLFKNLCGNVYNLGVTGSFNTAGVVDMGTGYVESAWTRTSADTPVSETESEKPYAVFGKPTADNGYQLVNSYFYEGNASLYNTVPGGSGAETTSGTVAHGKATAKPDKAFYNGELAYDLNNFYLYKRYSDHVTTSGEENERYSYFTIGDDGNLVLQNNHYYTSNPALCSTGYVDNQSRAIMYVEDRFADGDFRYAAGEIPTSADERYYSWKVNEGTPQEKEESCFFPIWPDDYIFFGQKLNYGYSPTETHQKVPTAVARDGGRLSLNADANRVYRAPAYFRSKDMSVAHFNPAVYLAQKENPETVEDGKTPREAYPGMTAIDFAGHNDTTWGLGSVSGGSIAGGNIFYPPLLDDDGLTSIRNCDETQNLLVYAPAATTSGASSATTPGASASGIATNPQTHGVLTAYFIDPAYTDHYNYAGGYKLVSENTAAITGHLVQHNLTATSDHLLVDKQDFNCPIAYDFDADHLMWYQRRPSDKEYVDHNAGWQGISLPFTAELVTTDTKGEITHFYSGSETSKNGTNTKIGHEYWLREFNAINVEGTDPVVAKASFGYPSATGADKTVTNTFLWDYYYQNTPVHNQKDRNADVYLEYQKYYKTSRYYSHYPLLAAATPYILGLPGGMYYEFDLSGSFLAKNTAVSIPRLSKQLITFASNKHEHIGVSDDETAGKKITYSPNGQEYTFKPNYMNRTLEVGDYALNSDGDAYVKLKSEAATNTTNKVTTAQSAFRPYFTVAASSGGSSRRSPNLILFVSDDSQIEEPLSVIDGSLEIFARDHKIIVRSHMAEAATVRIVNTGGIAVTDFVIKPGETIETPIRFSGIYIVNRKKVLVR